ncbi:MAG TPA: crossover junction endodeoxyribonuclease RuvC [Patescibacteria group bacterium]|nr:crossover junction endodeoxyribonuclease RuvC [Patescibacteria group bacterium]
MDYKSVIIYMKMRILGIDPGIGRTGWGVVEAQNSKLKVCKFGCIETPAKEDISKRLESVYDEITKLIKLHKPEEMAVEELFFNTNSKTAFAVGQARGVILLAGEKARISNFTYTPLEVKMSLTGYGRAEKGQVAIMVKNLLLLKEIPKPDDVSDALAVAITHSFSRLKRIKKAML